ncbi:MAG: hypothetical protein CMF74_18415 [Maricaulis sp.]|nr:hypothetical protein [Maricaulis sp.]
MGYARGKYAQAISDRSGMAFPYNEMVKEWNGSFVHKSEFEAKHPQIRRKHIKADAIALANARPRTPDNTGDFVLYITNGLLTNPGMRPTDGQGILGTELTSYSATMSLGTVSIVSTDTLTTLTTTVANVSGSNYYFIDGVQQKTLSFTRGQTYKFDQSAGTNDNHPLRLSTTSNGTHAGGSPYTTGVTTSGVPGTSGAYTQITVAGDAPDTLYYYCSNHSGMGGTINISG